jgi:GLPGLI family protein
MRPDSNQLKKLRHEHKIISLFMLLQSVALVASGGNAQPIQSSTNRANSNTKAIDSVVYRITYMTQSVKDTTKLDKHHRYKYDVDEMRLDIGRHINHFYSYTEARYDSALYAGAKVGAVADKSKYPSGSIRWHVYQNYPKGQTSFLDLVSITPYRVDEPTVQPKWEIIPDSSTTILGYRCTLAKTQFKGRLWFAWYTEGIPLNYGPWKFGGLPGLILRAYDSKRQYIFEGAGMQQLNGSQPIYEVRRYKKYEKVTLKEYLKALRETTPGESLATRGIKFGVSNDPEWNKKWEKYTKNVQPSNPIELTE